MSSEASDDTQAGFGIVPRYLRGRLKAAEMAVYVGLSWRVNDRGTCWIQHKRLAEEIGSSVSVVQRSLRSMRDKGIVTWEPKIEADGSTSCNIYTLHIFRGGPIPPSGQYDGGGQSIRPEVPVNMTDRTRPHERDSMNETGEPSVVVYPSVTREETTKKTPDQHLASTGLAPRDRGRFRTWLRQTRGARNTSAIILTEVATGELAESVREWRRTLDVETEPDAQPVECPHGHDIALGEHMCPQCDPARKKTPPASQLDDTQISAWIREALTADDLNRLQALLTQADTSTAEGITPSLMEELHPAT